MLCLCYVLLYLWMGGLLQFRDLFLVSFAVAFFRSLDRCVRCIDYKRKRKFSNDLIDNVLFGRSGDVLPYLSQLQFKIYFTQAENVFICTLC